MQKRKILNWIWFELRDGFYVVCLIYSTLCPVWLFYSFIAPTTKDALIMWLIANFAFFLGNWSYKNIKLLHKASNFLDLMKKRNERYGYITKL